MEKIDALGFIEVIGLVPAIEAADAMVKTASVRLLRQYEVRPGLVTVVAEGNLAACRAAVDAGTAAAGRIGTVVANHVIPRPDGDTENMVLTLIGRPDPKHTTRPEGNCKGTEQPAPAVAPTQRKAAKPIVEKAKKAKPVVVKATGVEGLTSAEMERVIAFIASGTRGRSWNDLTRNFPAEAGRLRAALEAAVRSGILEKIGARYRAPKGADRLTE